MQRRELPEDMLKMLEGTWLIRLNTRADGYYPTDLALEHCVREAKVRALTYAAKKAAN